MGHTAFAVPPLSLFDRHAYETSNPFTGVFTDQGSLKGLLYVVRYFECHGSHGYAPQSFIGITINLYFWFCGSSIRQLLPASVKDSVKTSESTLLRASSR